MLKRPVFSRVILFFLNIFLFLFALKLEAATPDHDLPPANSGETRGAPAPGEKGVPGSPGGAGIPTGPGTHGASSPGDSSGIPDSPGEPGIPSGAGFHGYPAN
jgi:hypothetical protein